VLTGPGVELDADGWFPWAVWVWYSEYGGGSTARRELASLGPAVRRAADATAASLSPAGLPPPSPDYWEEQTSQPTIGTAAPLLAGLRAAARLAASLGNAAGARRWTAAAARLDRGIQAAYGPQFNRFPNGTGGPGTWLALFGTAPGATRDGLSADSVLNGPDAAVTFLGPPFAPPSAAVDAAVARAARILTLPDGGILPGTTWRGDRTVAWTPATGFFALYDAAAGHQAAATAWLSWLAAHRTADGALPEQVNGSGQPVSVAPLAWTCAIVLLAMTAMRHPLPVP
jgi:GH15 family glucan-1,4-alpha-glucosidase